MKTILVDETAPIATITLNQPEVRNALTATLIDEMSLVLKQWEARADIRAVLVTGTGRVFSAGADLKSLKQLLDNSAEENRRDSRRMADFLKSIYLYPKPVLAAVNGPAYGGGCGLISVCDLAVAAQEAALSYSEVKIGFVPAIVTTFLLRSLGEKRSRELLLTGKLIDAPTALYLGLYNAVVPASDLLVKTRALAEEVISNSPSALAMTKGTIARIRSFGLDEALAMAVETNVRARSTADFREGVTAFLEKRKPRWKD